MARWQIFGAVATLWLGAVLGATVDSPIAEAALLLVFALGIGNAAMMIALGPWPLRDETIISGDNRLAIAILGSVTEGPLVTMAQDCMVALCTEVLERNCSSEWLDVANRIQERTNKELGTVDVSKAREAKDFLDSLDSLDGPGRVLGY